jgi:hypothetical protein
MHYEKLIIVSDYTKCDQAEKYAKNISNKLLYNMNNLDKFLKRN